MQVIVNGQAREIPDHLTLAGLLGHLELKGEHVAIERNRKLVKRAEWARVEVQAGDRLEIVQFVGGG
jgi:thiamine biosynthesis protein ThiS